MSSLALRLINTKRQSELSALQDWFAGIFELPAQPMADPKDRTSSIARLGAAAPIDQGTGASLGPIPIEGHRRMPETSKLQGFPLGPKPRAPATGQAQSRTHPYEGTEGLRMGISPHPFQTCLKFPKWG